MDKIQIQLLGPPKISRDGKQLAMTSEHPLFLLAYLAAKNTWVTRQELSSLLYPEVIQSVGKTRLRQLIQRIKELRIAPSLEIMPEQLRWLSGSDLHFFREASQNQHWQQAYENYHGGLLQNLDLFDTACGEWLEQERRNLEREWCEVSLNYATTLEKKQDHQAVVGVLETVLEKNLFAEDVLIVYLRNATLAGRHEQALRMYVEFSQRLQDELGMSPHPNTIEAFKLFRQEEVVAPSYDLRTNHFLGREKEFRLLKDLLTCNKYPLINVVGLGGIGKTRLVLEVIQAHVEKVVFVSCLVLDAEQSLEKHIANSLGLELDEKLTPIEGLYRVLEKQSLLLVLDNVEHILGAVRLLIQTLIKLVNIRFLLTSRTRLGISQEFVLELDGLVCQDSSLAINSDSSFALSSAAQVFVQLLQMQPNSIQLNFQDRQQIEAIVTCLAGVPLGIELAVAWTRLRPLSEILLELQHNLDFLADGLSGIPERHNGLRAIFEQTWNSLKPPLQIVLQRLSVFVGSIDRGFALQITLGQDKDLLRLLDCGVLKRSLGQANRFELHSIIRGYAKEKLKQQPADEQSTYERLIRLAVELTTKHGPLAQARSAQILSQEYPNICAAITWALDNQAIKDALQIGIGLTRYWPTLNLKQEGIDWLKKLIKNARLYTNSEIYVECMLSLVLLYRSVNQYEEAIKWNRKALKIAILNKYISTKGRIYMNFGLFALLNLDYKKAEKYHRKSLKIIKENPQETRIIGATVNLSRILVFQNKDILAERKLKNILSFAKKINNKVSIITINITFSIIEIRKGELQKAKERILKTLKIAASIKNHTGDGICYYYLALIYLKNKEYEEARVVFEKSLRLGFLHNLDFMTISSIKNIAQIYMFQINFEKSLQYWLLAKLLEKNAKGINDATFYHALIDTKILWRHLGVNRYQQICKTVRGSDIRFLITQLLKELPPAS